MSDYLDPFLLKDAYEVSDFIREALRPKIATVGPLQFRIVSNPGMPPDRMLFWCGPKPEQQVWVTGLAPQESDVQVPR